MSVILEELQLHSPVVVVVGVHPGGQDIPDSVASEVRPRPQHLSDNR